MKRIATWTLLALVLGFGGAQAAILTVDAGGGGDYTNLAPAIDAALPGDTITIADGTYVQSATLNVNKALIIQGASEAGVIINCAGVAGYGFLIDASDVTMENMTILPPTPNFPIHASGATVLPDGLFNLTLRFITISGVHQRTGFDIHGYTNVVLSNLTSSDASGGNGLQLTGCVDVTADNITTYNNAWGSIAIYCSDGTSYLGRGCSNVVIDGATLSVGEDNIYIQDEFGLLSSGIAVTGYGYHVRNTRFLEPNPGSEGYTFVKPDLAVATAVALALPFPEASTIFDLVSDQYVVVPGLSIQAAIDAAAPADVVGVDAGLFREQLFIDKDLTLTGAGMGVTTLEAPDAIDRTTYDITTWTSSPRTLDPVIGVLGATVAISGFTVDGRDTGPDNFYGIYYHDASGSVTDCTVTNVTYPAGPGAQRVVSVAFSHGAVTGPFTVVCSDNVVPTFQKGGILVMGPEMVFTVERNQVSANPTPDIAGNGIQLSYGATGTTAENVVTGVGYTGTDWAGTGILLFESGDITMVGDTVTGSQAGVNYSDWRWVYAHPVPVNLVFQDLVLTDNEWSFGAQLSGLESDLNLVMDGCAITGSTGDAIDVFGTGVDPWGGSYYTGWDNGDLDVTITGLTMDNTAIDGIWTADLSGNVTNTVAGFSVTGSSFDNTVGAAVANGFTTVVDAPANYWGDLGGPIAGAKAGATKQIAPAISPAGFDLPRTGYVREVTGGSGDKVAQTVTGLVDFSPWYGLPLGTAPMTLGTNDSIGDALDLANDGDTINVAAGHYEEQVHVTANDLTITGAGVGATFVDAPADMPLFFTSSDDNYPIVFVDGASGTALTGMTIDGQGNGALNYRFVGLGLHNADGAYSDLHVTRVRNEPLNGSQHGVGLYVINDDAAARAATFTDVSVDDTQKNAVVFDGDGLAVEALRLACTGNGPLGLGLPAQNGVQVSGGAFANLTDCTIADYNYTEPDWTATGLLVFGPGSADMTGGSISGTKTSIYYIDASGTVDGITVTDPQGDPLYAYASPPVKAASTIVQVQGLDAAPNGNPNKADIAFVLRNSTFTGNGVVDSWGPTAWAEGNVDFTVEGCTIENFDNGLNLYEAGGAVTGSAAGNLIQGNLTYGAWSNTVVPFDARNNNWGDISGPYHPTLNPTGLGNEVSDNILFEPWAGQAGLGVTPVASGPLTCGQTLELTFQYTADELTPDMFLYNVVVRVPPQVTFNTVRDELPFGTVNNNFFVVDNLDGTWTFTGSTVGNPMSPVVGPGTFDLFTIICQTATDGLGDVAIEDYALRDPDNQPIPAGVSGATVLVDCTAPVAVTGITALPGHTKIDVSWTHDGTDVDHYEVFVGEWQDGSGGSAYPEYDDLTGNVIPTRPADYAAAAASPQWVSLGSFLVTELTQNWTDPVDRGVYYYEVFAIDTAGNASVPAAANDRATNYWLGDVYGDAAGDYVGNGLVNVRDVNYLAASYGDPVPAGHPDNVLDVGPTDDLSRVGIPLTDNVLNFEDLMIFSMNFGVVSPAKDRAPVGNRVALSWVDYGDGRYGLRLAEGASLKGLRVTAAVEVAAVEAGTLLDDQSELTFVANVGDGLDASVAVMGVNVAFAGTGDLLVIDAASAIDVADLAITARATDNSDLEVTVDKTSDTLAPRVFAVYPNYPNPFNPMTKISFSLPESQAVRLGIYSVDGRLVRTLVNEVRGPGLHEVIWNGQDNTGRQAASGVYFYRVDAGPHSEVRKMTLMK